MKSSVPGTMTLSFFLDKADMSDVPGTSKSVSSEPIVPQLHLEYAPSSPNTLSEDQFKIVIRTKPSSNSSAADNYTINLDDLPDNSSTPADVRLADLFAN